MRWELCTDCSLCVSACPTRALIPSEPTRRDYAEALESAQVRITCRREADVGTLRVGCLASVPWELPAVFALRGKLCLYTRACASCPREMQRAAVTAAVEALKSFLGPGLFRERVQIVDGEDTPLAVPEETPEMPAVTRRELFGGIRRRAEKRLFREAEKRLPLLLGEQAEPPGSARRSVLIRPCLSCGRRAARALCISSRINAPPARSVWGSVRIRAWTVWRRWRCRTWISCRWCA